MLHLQNPFQPSLEVPSRWAHSGLPNWAPIQRDVHPQSLPFVTFRAPSNGAPPPGSPNRAPIERDAPFPEPPYNYLSRVPGDQTPMGWCPSPEPSPYRSGSPEWSPPNRAPAKRDAPFPQPSNSLLKFLVNRLPRFPNRPLWRKAPICRTFFYTFTSKSPVNEPPPPCSPTGSLWREKLHFQSQWLIHSFVSVGVPSNEPSHEKWGKHLVTVHGSPHGLKAYIQWVVAWFPKGTMYRVTYTNFKTITYEAHCT
jgi:hypothetical protein